MRNRFFLIIFGILIIGGIGMFLTACVAVDETAEVSAVVPESTPAVEVTAKPAEPEIVLEPVPLLDPVFLWDITVLQKTDWREMMPDEWEEAYQPVFSGEFDATGKDWEKPFWTDEEWFQGMLSYAVRDIDGNGIPELLIGSHWGYYDGLTVLTLYQGQPVVLYDYWYGGVGSPPAYVIYQNGMILVSGGGGAGKYHYYEYYKISAKGDQLELVDGVSVLTQKDDEGEYYTRFTSSSGLEMSEKEVDAFLDQNKNVAVIAASKYKYFLSDDEDIEELDWRFWRDPGYSQPLSDERYLEGSGHFSKWELSLDKYEIYARHGSKFSNPEVQAYFDMKDWYVPTVEAKNFTTAYALQVFNEYELANVQFLAEQEQRRERENAEK